MRETKFRLICNNKIVGYLKLEKGWTQFQEVGSDDWVYPCSFKWEKAEQYTGLKDKNIWENDVMQSIDGLRKYVVTYSERRGLWYLKGLGKTWDDSTPEWDRYKKIGTIHDKENQDGKEES